MFIFSTQNNCKLLPIQEIFLRQHMYLFPKNNCHFSPLIKCVWTKVARSNASKNQKWPFVDTNCISFFPDCIEINVQNHLKLGLVLHFHHDICDTVCHREVTQWSWGSFYFQRAVVVYRQRQFFKASLLGAQLLCVQFQALYCISSL